MKVVILQIDIAWGDIAANIKCADELIAGHPGCDIYVLPEMFSTGFCTDPNGLADTADGPSLAWMKSVAKQNACAICGSVAISEGGEYFNRFYFVHPDGSADHYDKRHLFAYGGEDKHYTAGERRVIVNFRGVRILLQVCYDLRFPVFARNRKDYDMVIYVANWPTSRIDVWNTLLAARAIENQCYVVGVNIVGSDPVCDYCGSSKVIDPYGKVVARCEDNVEGCATADIDMDKLIAFREKFPVLNDADEI